MGLSLPVIDEQPIIRTDLLHLTQDLFLEYNFIDKKVEIENFIYTDYQNRKLR